MPRHFLAALVSLFSLASVLVPIGLGNHLPPLYSSVPARSLRPPAQFPIAETGSSAAMKSQIALRAKVAEIYGKMPLSFESNQGQTDGRVRFLSRGSRDTLFLTSDGAVFSLRGKNGKANDSVETVVAGRELQSEDPATMSAVLRMRLLNANPSVKISGEEKLAGKRNYFIGKNPVKWCTNVSIYAKVKYAGVYPGIDLVYYGNQRQLEYDFVVAPSADPTRIKFEVGGAKHMHRDDDGDLVLATPHGEVRWRKPLVYQEKNGERQQVDGRYVIKAGQQVGFEVAAYDRQRQLIIDPVVFLSYSTYLGGTGDDEGQAIAVDSEGNAYVTGTTSSTDFPSLNAAQPTNAGAYDVFVSKLSPSGSALVYSTYLGGSGSDYANAIALDASGNVYIAGYTTSTDFPTLNPVQPAFAGGMWDAFVTKLDASGSALVYSTYLGGGTGPPGSSYFPGSDLALGIGVDSTGAAYVTGWTTAIDFPTVNALQGTFSGNGVDAFVSKLSPSGSTLVYSTFLGGTGAQNANAIAVDASGNAYVTGFTTSSDFPTTANAFQPAIGAGESIFVTKLSASGSAFVYSTYLGGGSFDSGQAIAVDDAGSAYVTGLTSGGFPTLSPVQPGLGGGSYDAFVTKLNPSGSALIYSTYLGGSGNDEGTGIAVDAMGNAYVTGHTNSPDFPTKNAFQTTCGWCNTYGVTGYDAFVAELIPLGSALVFSTYFGGSGNNGSPGYNFGSGVAADGAGNVYVAGTTNSPTFPTANPLKPTCCSTSDDIDDAFVSKLTFPIVTITGSPQLPLTKNSAGNFVALVTITNSGNVTVNSTQVTVSGTTLGSSALLAPPPPVTNLAPGASAIVTLRFPPTSGTTTMLKVSGSYSVPAVQLSGNWALSFRSVSLP
jgi:hypothetical protein